MVEGWADIYLIFAFCVAESGEPASEVTGEVASEIVELVRL